MLHAKPMLVCSLLIMRLRARQGDVVVVVVKGLTKPWPRVPSCQLQHAFLLTLQ